MLIIFNIGTGEMIKAALVPQVCAVAICANLAHKKMVLENMMAFLKSKGLVNLAAGAPTKSADLVAFEQRLQVGARVPDRTLSGKVLLVGPLEDGLHAWRV